MAIPLTGPQSLFVRLGHIFGMVDSINYYRGTVAPPMVDVIRDDYQTTDRATVDGIYATLTQLQGGMSSVPYSLRELARSTLLEMVNEDTPQNSQTSLQAAMQYLIDQMTATSVTVDKCNLSSSFTQSSANTGNPSAAVTFKFVDGSDMQNCFNETYVVTVTSDAQSGGASAGLESYLFSGPYAVTDPLSWEYPGGSGTSTSVRSVNGASGATSGYGNHINNGGFESWTVANTPDAWTVQTGTPGVTVLQSTSSPYAGASCLQFAGNNSENTAVYQQFNMVPASAGSSVALSPLDQLAFNVYLKSSTTPASGAVRVRLVDGSNAVTYDASGAPNEYIIQASGLSTSWQNYSGFFRTPRVLPSAFRLFLDVYQTLPSSGSVFIDNFSFTHPYYLYRGGPGVAVFCGNVNVVKGDNFRLAVVNDYAGNFQRHFDSIFDMRSMGLQLPYSASGTISSGLIPDPTDPFTP